MRTRDLDVCLDGALTGVGRGARVRGAHVGQRHVHLAVHAWRESRRQRRRRRRRRPTALRRRPGVLAARDGIRRVRHVGRERRGGGAAAVEGRRHPGCQPGRHPAGHRRRRRRLSHLAVQVRLSRHRSERQVEGRVGGEGQLVVEVQVGVDVAGLAGWRGVQVGVREAVGGDASDDRYRRPLRGPALLS